MLLRSLMQDRKSQKALLATLIALLFSYLMGWAAVDEENTRLLITVSFLVLFAAIQLKSPQAALFSIALFLPFLGLLRKLLIPLVGWNSMDTLVILCPLAVLLLTTRWMVRTYLQREPIADDTLLFRLIRLMLVIDLLQIFNPLQGSILVGFAGVIYYMVPVFMMVLSREYLDEKWIRRILASVFVIGILVAAYGFKQFWFGMYFFERKWMDLSGYTALYVYDLVRPISTFNNAAEYAHFLVIAICAGWGYFLRGASGLRFFALAGVVFLFAALFVESGRGPIVTVTAALFVMTILSVKKLRTKLLLCAVSVGVLVALFIGMTKMDTSNALIYHSVIGLTDPFGEESTLVGHLHYMVDGFVKSFHTPLGHGLGSTTIASGKFGGNLVSSEVDLSNKFLSTGVFGGMLYMVIFFMTLGVGIRMANGGSMIHLIIVGMLVGEALQWLTGGHYAVMAVLWMGIGFLDRSSGRQQASKGQPANGRLT